MSKEYITLRYAIDMKAKSEDAELTVYGEITPYKYGDWIQTVTAKDFDKMLKDAKSAGAKRLHMRINSSGGDVFQAIAMRTMLISCGMDIDISIDGMCASAATLLCCIPDAKVSIAEGGMFMIHNPVSGIYGNAEAMEKSALNLRKMENDFHGIYAKRCGHSEEKIKDWMDAETWFTAKEAVESGFCDSVTDGEAVAASADAMRFMMDAYRNVPEGIRVSNDIQQNHAAISSENIISEEEETEMDFKDITLENLREGNPAVFDQIMQAGAAQERERIADIDDLTSAGYEAMAKDAKASGMSAMDFHKAIVKAQREKGAAFIANRAKETEPAANVTGGDTADNDEKMKADIEDQCAKDVANYAKAERADNGGMY